MNLPTRDEAQKILGEHVKDEYQLYHARMVGSAMEGYARIFGEDVDLWHLTGLLHDIDFEEYPEEHPAKSLVWFKEWGYPSLLVHAVEAHAYGYHDFNTKPETKLASALLACDEICGIFYAYKKLNPVPYGEMKVSSIKKRFAEKTFASKINRDTITFGCEHLGVPLDEHIGNLILFLKDFE